MSGTRTRPLWVRLTHQGEQVNAQIERTNETLVLRVLREHNNPTSIAAFRETGPPTEGTILNVTFTGDKYAELGAKLSWFRSGYLALFAVAGYRFAFNPASKIVRKELIDYEQRYIECFTVVVPDEISFTTRRILQVTEPDWMSSTAVQVGRYILFCPNPGDLGFYGRLNLHRRSSQGAQFTADSFDWPTEPTFGIVGE
jgi:hypothetical protein